MILISGLLGLVAIATLAVGTLAMEEIRLVYVSIGSATVAFVLLAIGVYRARAEFFGGGSATSTTGSGKGGRSTGSNAAARAKAAKSKSGTPKRAPAASRPARASGRRPGDGSGGATRPAGKAPASTPDVPGDTIVVVVPGRKRYHLANCRQLAGRTREELTYQEAREEGFTACTACMPDTALAARGAEAHRAADEPAEEPSDETAAEEAGETAETSVTEVTEETAAAVGGAETSAEDAQEGGEDTPTERFQAVTSTSEDTADANDDATDDATDAEDDTAADRSNGQAETAEATEGVSGARTGHEGDDAQRS